jgi:hypothetical protein
MSWIGASPKVSDDTSTRLGGSNRYQVRVQGLLERRSRTNGLTGCKRHYFFHLRSYQHSRPTHRTSRDRP